MVSIIILNFNGLEFLSSCLNSVFNTAYPNYEVIFVDNNSSDGSVEFVREKFGKNLNLRIVELDQNCGSCEGNNVGAQCASGKYLVFLNMDTEVHEDWINELVNVFEKDKTIGAAQSKLLLWDKRRIDSMGHFLTAYGSWSSYVPYEQYDDNRDDETQEIFIAHGAALATRHEIFEKAGRFDGDFFMYADEIDLCWRIWLSGHRVLLVPSSVVYHYGGGVAGRKTKQSPLRAYHHTRNLLITIFKNYSDRSLFRYAPLVISRVLYASIVSSLNRSTDPRLVTRRLLGIIDFARKLRSTWRKRIRVQYLVRCISDDLLFEKGLIRKNRF